MEGINIYNLALEGDDIELEIPTKPNDKTTNDLSLCFVARFFTDRAIIVLVMMEHMSLIWKPL